MILKKRSFAILLLAFPLSCSAPLENKSNAEVLSSGKGNPSEMALEFSVKDTIISFGDLVELNISLTNKGHGTQKILFDKPRVSTGGPWAISASVTDRKTHRSVLKYENKAILSSQVYTQEQLKSQYYFLKPGQSVHGKYTLDDIVVFEDNWLPKGTYDIQLLHTRGEKAADLVLSNVVTLTVQ